MQKGFIERGFLKQLISNEFATVIYHMKSQQIKTGTNKDNSYCQVQVLHSKPIEF